MVSRSGQGRLWCALAAVAALGQVGGGCSYDLMNPDRQSGAISDTRRADGFHVRVVTTAEPPAVARDRALLEIHLDAVGRQEMIAGFKVVVSYDPKSLRVQEVHFPENILGTWASLKDGQVVLAGVAPSGLSSSKLASLLAREVVSEPSVEVLMQEIVGAVALNNLMDRLVPRKRH